jgi:hypothetical protein
MLREFVCERERESKGEKVSESERSGRSERERDTEYVRGGSVCVCVCDRECEREWVGETEI